MGRSTCLGGARTIFAASEAARADLAALTAFKEAYGAGNLVGSNTSHVALDRFMAFNGSLDEWLLGNLDSALPTNDAVFLQAFSSASQVCRVPTQGIEGSEVCG